MSYGMTEGREYMPAHVSKRLYATIAVFIGLICIFGGYMLGRMTRPEIKRNNDMGPLNLTIAADMLYKGAKRISHKVIHHNDPKKIEEKLISIFHCNQTECGTINKDNLGEYVKSAVNYQVSKLIKSIQNATLYLDSLR